LAEDSIGHLWIGNEEGLFCFDGQTIYPVFLKLVILNYFYRSAGLLIIPFTPYVDWNWNMLAFHAEESELCNTCIKDVFALNQLPIDPSFRN